MLPVTASWLPGLYLVESWSRGRPSGACALVVRASSPQPSRAAVMYSNLTWTAYSPAGGASLYKGERADGAAGRALAVAVQRPLVRQGLLRLLTGDVPVAAQLDRLGIAAGPLADTDVDAWPSLLAGRVELVLPGHSEYWTRRMFDAVTAARNAGTNLADLGANEMYWHARLTRTADGTPASMFVARTLGQDPLAQTFPAEATVQWRDAPLLRDPVAVLGNAYTAVNARGGAVVVSVPPWLSTVPGLRRGRVLEGVAWNETDGPTGPATGAPTDVQVIALGVLTHPGKHAMPMASTYYSAPSGAGVFAAGTTYWPCFVMASCPDAQLTPAVRRVVAGISARVLRAFLAPRFGASHPSTGTPLPPAGRLVATLPRGAVGTYGSGN